ncbi:MAG: family 10 glycosylhydrolase [Clostridia bacterium]|nr:family 10 glycosylhydrolase [Clostridia bacterium]
MKKIIVILLAVLMCAGMLSFAVSAEEKTQSVTAENRGRGENELIVYTPAFGKTTATNEWGSEAVVGADNKIISVTTRVGNAEIPEGGFVVSGHGEMDGWVKNNLKAGMYCYYDARSSTILLSTEPTQYGGMYFTVEREINGFNKTRGENALIIYNQSGSTATNEWGTEAIVGADGRITSVGGNNNKVPKGGFVISGHGVNSDWVTKNAKVGMKASYDTATNILTLEMDADAYINLIDMGIQQLKTKRDNGKSAYAYYNYDYITECLNQMAALRAKYETLTDDNDMADCIAQINELLNKGLSACSESRTVEFRGVWIRPTQKTQTEVAEYVQRLYDAGINTLCIETLYDSTLIFPAPEGSDFEHNPKFNGFDVLKAYVEECHKRDMELHVWMPIFYSSHTTCSNLERSVWYKNPSWRNINNSGKDTCVNDDDDFCFLNPAHPEVQEFLLGTYQYILENYDIDGFELDYIRYQDGINDDYGYDPLTVGGFKEKYGVVPQYNTAASYWDNWVQYRCDIITGFVGKMRAMFNEYGEDVLLCADVGPDAKGARNGIYQDYSNWISKGWIDLLKPMSYTYDSVEATDKNVEKMNGKYLASGIGVYSDSYSGYDASTHVPLANEKGADGVMFFEASTYLGKGTSAFLVEGGAFRNRAITPTLDIEKAVTAAVDYALDRITNVILPFGGKTKADCESLKAKLEAFKGLVPETGNEELAAKLNEIISALSDSAADKAIKGDLEYVIKILSNKERTVVSDTDIPDVGIDDSAVSEYENSFEESIKTEESKLEESKKEESLREESIKNELNKNDSSADVSESENGGNTGLIIGIAIGAAVIIVIAAVIVVKKKK